MRPTQGPSMRDVAKSAGVSVSAVSLAMRGSPKVSPAKRAEIMRMAKKLGYRRNALVASLMNQVRRRTIARGAGPSLAFVQARREYLDHPFMRDTWEGARAQADAAGYRLDRFFWDDEADPGALGRVLYNRGYHGAIIQARPEGVRLERDWHRLCLVGIERDKRAPELDYVEHHHFRSMFTVLERCRDAGLERVGFAHGVSHSGMDSHYEWVGALRACAPALGLTASFLPLAATEADLTAVPRWVESERPDVLIGVSTYALGLLRQGARSRRSAASPCFVDLDIDSVRGNSRHPGIVQDHREIGASALNFLSGKTERNETGLGVVARALLIEGRWQGVLRAKVERRG